MNSERCGDMRDGGGSGEGSQLAAASLERPDEALPPTAVKTPPMSKCCRSQGGSEKHDAEGKTVPVK